MKILAIGLLFVTSTLFGASIVNDTCPYSGKPIKETLTHTISVCPRTRPNGGQVDPDPSPRPVSVSPLLRFWF